MNEPLPARDEDRPGPAAPQTGFLAVLSNRNFLEIWLAQVTSQTSQNALWYALIIMVGAITGEQPVTVGFTIIMVQLPTVLFSSVAGVFVDRVPKRSILIGTNALRVVGVLGYLVLQHNLAGLYIITFVVAVMSQPFAPAEGATIPLLVSGEQLITANSLFQLTFMGAQGVGFALAPIAIPVLGVTHTLILLAALFAVAAVLLIPLPASARAVAVREPIALPDLGRRVIHDLLEAVHFIVDDPPLAVALLQLSLAPTLLLLLAEVGPDFVANTLHFGQASTALFFLLAPAGIGLGLGMFVLGQFGARLRTDRLVLISLIALGLTVIGLAAVPLEASFWQQLHAVGLPIPSGVGFTLTMFPITVLMGLEVAFINAPAQTVVQERAAPEVRGRVLAMQQTLTAALAIPPLIIVGGVASLIGTPATLTLAGITISAIGLVLVYYA